MNDTQFFNFIKGLLRKGSMRWAPRNNVLKNARVERGVYMCAGYGAQGPHTVPASIITTLKNGKTKRIRNVLVDHIQPVVDTAKGFVGWDEYIKRMFCNEDNFQVLCHECHQNKCNDEKQEAKARRAND